MRIERFYVVDNSTVLHLFFVANTFLDGRSGVENLFEALTQNSWRMLITITLLHMDLVIETSPRETIDHIPMRRKIPQLVHCINGQVLCWVFSLGRNRYI